MSAGRSWGAWGLFLASGGLVAELLGVASGEASSSCLGEVLAAFGGGLDANAGGGDTGLYGLLYGGC